MKKYLFIWSVAAALCLSAQAKAEVCADTPSCADMNYTYSTTEVGRLGSRYVCTACPLDGTKWSCAPLDAQVQNDPCADYPYTTEQKAEMMETGGYTCTICPKVSATDANARYMCRAKSCPSGYTTNVSAVCNKYKKGTCITSPVWNEMYSAYINVPLDGQGDECTQYYRGPCSLKTHIGGIWDEKYVSQYSFLSESNCYNDMYKATGIYGDYSKSGWKEYRCKKGYSGDKACVKSTTVRTYTGDGYDKIEPCKYLFGAEPYIENCDFSLSD